MNKQFKEEMASSCINCFKLFNWTFERTDTGEWVYKNVYNTGDGNRQMCVKCAKEKGVMIDHSDSKEKERGI